MLQEPAGTCRNLSLQELFSEKCYSYEDPVLQDSAGLSTSLGIWFLQVPTRPDPQTSIYKIYGKKVLGPAGSCWAGFPN